MKRLRRERKAQHAAPSQVLLRGLLRFLLEQLGDNLLDHLIRKYTDFFWCFRLNRMRDKDRFVL